MKFNLDNFVIDKVIVITKYFLRCPKCNWQNLSGAAIYYCPQCGEDLVLSKETTREVDYE